MIPQKVLILINRYQFLIKYNTSKDSNTINKILKTKLSILNWKLGEEIFKKLNHQNDDIIL